MYSHKHIKHNFHSVDGIMPQGWDLGVLGVKNFSVGICDGAPSTARSSSFCNHPVACSSFVKDNVISREG